VTRLLPGALGNEGSAINESFSALDDETTNQLRATYRREALHSRDAAAWPASGTLDFPHYTRPADFRGWQVPEVLIGGNHKEVRKWRATAALEKTRRNRPDLL
jgi:tRNA (guanine37-N1)-methyltransferase